jgi:hypothetical protein
MEQTMSTEWNEETIYEHMFTEVELSTGGDTWFQHKLGGFCPIKYNPFISDRGGEYRHMRLITKPKKRLMTIKELWGKTLVSHNGCLVTVNKVDSHNQIKMLSAWNTVEEVHLNDWRLAGPDLDYDTATSLEVDDE